MFKKLLAIVATVAMLAASGQVFAAVDVNTANESALLDIKGIGSAKAKAILDERNAHGPYKDGADLAKRVKGMGGKTVERLQAEGLVVGPAGGAGAAQVAAPARPGAAGAPASAQKNSAAVAVKK
jgi:competence protein ComEA